MSATPNAIEQVEAPPLAYLPSEAEEAHSEATGQISGHVTMSRALAESAHGLTLNEARVMMLAMRVIDPRTSPYKYAEHGKAVTVRVHASQFAELAELAPEKGGYTNRAAYEGLKAAVERIFERVATWKEGKKTIKMRWVYKAVYHANEGWAEISFSPDMTRHIFMISDRFVRYRLEFARGLRSVYSTNLLRLLMTQKDTGFKTITIENFRAAMEVPEKYKYADIKRYAIVRPVQELNEKADIHIEWSETKKGNRVSSVQFRFKFVKSETARQTTLDF